MNNGKILFVLPVPPPYTGMEKMGEIILNSRITQELSYAHIDSGNKQSSNAQRGHFSLKNLLYTFRISLNIFYVVLTQNIKIANIPIACNKLGFLKFSTQILICSLFRIRIVSRLGASHFNLFYESQRPIYKMFIRFVMNRIDLIIVRGKEQHSQFKNIYKGKYECIYAPSTGIKKGVLNPDDRTKHKDCINILFLGMISQAKGAHDLLKSIPLVLEREKHVCFHFVGDIVENHEEKNVPFFQSSSSFNIEQFIDKNKISANVTFHGPCYGEKKHRILQNSDLLIFPSYSEGSPFTVIEAMEYGLPIIATRVGNLPELFENKKNVLFVDQESPDQIANAIIHIIQNPDHALLMVKNNFKILCSTLSLKTFEEKMIKLFNGVLES